MSRKSNDNGRAFEYVVINMLCEKINKFRPARITKNDIYNSIEKDWKNLDTKTQLSLRTGAKAFLPTLLELEPTILEKSTTEVELLIQPDSRAKEGDVRDVLIIRNDIEWEIGLSLKHNHFAVKHSRLSHVLDFGKEWYGTPCSERYWNEIKPIFDYLKHEKANKTKWDELANKFDNVYKPLLEAFVKEIKQAYLINNNIPIKMVEYLLGRYDFYKVVSMDSKKITHITAFNLRSTLNRKSTSLKASSTIPKTLLPTRIVNIDFAPDKKHILELYMDNGWQFSFRIHNASTYVEPSLKFDIQIVGMPTTIVTIHCNW